MTDAVPAGLTPTGATGTGWSCGTGGQTVNCTRSDALGAGQSYPAVTIPVTVAANASSGVDTATVSRGGETNTANDTATDPTPVAAVPSFTLSVDRHAGSGLGTITGGAGNSTDISCAVWSHVYTSGTTVTLTAVPAADSTITSWAGCDSSTATTCSITMTADTVTPHLTLTSTDATTRYVQLVYHDLFDRVAEQSGQDYWVNQINGGTPRDQISVAFTQSREYRATQVGQLYQHYLHRPADT